MTRMKFVFVTLFPEMIEAVVSTSILGRARRAGRVDFQTVNPRDFTTDRHRTVDGSTYGGGPGMLMMVEPLALALRSLNLTPDDVVILFEPSGTRFRQATASRLANSPRIVLVCGHYEGIDQRIHDEFSTEVLSMGDFVLTGGELPAMTVADAVTRLLPEVLGDAQSLVEDSHSDGLLSYPQYAKPSEFEGLSVPEVLTSGDHGKVARFRRQHQVRTTRTQRPDLFCQAPLDVSDLDWL